MCLLLSKLLPKINIHTIRTSISEVATSLVIKDARDLNLQGWSWSHWLEVYIGDLKHEQDLDQGIKSVDSKPSLVTVLDLLWIGILEL